MNRLKIKITGKNPDYFLKELINRKINIYSLEKNYNNIIVIVNYDDYERIKEMKTSYKISIIEKYGILKIKDYLKRYMYFIIFILVGILINIILSNLILKIEVVHPNKKLVNIITKDLKELGLKKYNFKISNKRKEKIKEEILLKEKDKVEWIEIENIGTKYIIKLEQRKKNEEEKECKPRHIIAKKEAMIIDVEASSGEIKKKKLDYVTKGEVIISGFIYNKEDVVSKKCSIGKVYGETWYRVGVNVPKEYIEKEELNKKDYGISINLFKKTHNFGNKLKNYKKTEYNIIKGKVIPISINFCKYQEVKITKKIYTVDNVDKIALELADKKINSRLKKDEGIISKKVLKKSIKNSKIEVEVFYKVKEDITDYLDISNVNIEEINKKEE